VVLWAVLYACLLLAVAASITWPMGRDQGIFAWVAEVIAEGGFPYTDAWEVKGPATFLPYVLAHLALGRNQWGIRLVDAILFATAGLFCWRCLVSLGARRGAVLAPWLFGAWYWQLGYWHTAQADGWMAFLLLGVLSILCSDGGAKSTFAGVGLGALIGIGTLLKPIFGVYFVLPILLTPWAPGRREASWWRWPTSVAVGFLLTIGLGLLWLSVGGASGEMLKIQFGFASFVHQGAHSYSISEHLGFLFRFATRAEYVVAMPLVWIGLTSLWRRNRRLAGINVAAIILTVAILALQSKYWLYHLTPLLAPLALLFGIGVDATQRALRGQSNQADSVDFNSRRLAHALLAVIIVINLAALWPSVAQAGRTLTGRISREDYSQWFDRHQSDFSLSDISAAARYLRERTTEQETVQVWAFDPLINYVSARRSPTRFGYLYPLVGGDRNPYQTEWRREFMQVLRAGPPTYVVVGRADRNNLMSKTSLQYLEDFPEFRSYLLEAYRVEAEAGRYMIMRRKD